MARSQAIVRVMWAGLSVCAWGCTGDVARMRGGSDLGAASGDPDEGKTGSGNLPSDEATEEGGAQPGTDGEGTSAGSGNMPDGLGPSDPPPPPACDESLADRSLATDLSSLAADVAQCGSFAEGGRMAAPHPCARVAGAADGTLRFAYADKSGVVHVVGIDAAGKLFGSELTVPGDDVRGLVVHDDGVALLVARGIKLYLVRLTAAGDTSFEVMVEGADDTGEAGARFLDLGLRAGALDWDGKLYTVYAAIKQNYGPQGTHEGDVLTSFDAQGTRNDQGGWDWGCSHSLDLRLAPGMGKLAPICQADVYPKPGIIARNSRQLVATPDLTGGGGAIWSGYASQPRAALLGGAVADGDSVFISFASDDAGSRATRDIGVLRFGESSIGSKVWHSALPADQIAWSPELMRFGKNLLLYWETSAVEDSSAESYVGHLMELTPEGAATSTTTQIPAGETGAAPFTLKARDVPAVSVPGGDAVYLASPTATSLSVVRLRSCE